MNRQKRERHHYESMWDNMDTTRELLKQIFDENIFDSQQILKFHAHVYDFCSGLVRNTNFPYQDAGGHLYEGLTNYLDIRLQNIAKDMENQVYDDDLIAKYAEHWVHYQKSCEILDHGCLYLNRNWVKRERFEGKKYIQPVYRLAMIRWKELVFGPIDTSLVNAITLLLRQKPSDNTKSLVYQVLQSIVELYANDENQRVPVHSKLDNVFIEEVVGFYKSTTMAEFQRIIVSNYYANFKHFLKYACLAMPEIVDGVQFKAILKRHLVSQVQEAIAKSLTGKDYIQAILGFCHSTLARAMHDHKTLVAIVDMVCKDAINKMDQKINPIRLIVEYANELMTKKPVSEKAFIDELRRIAEIVEFLNEKDIFIHWYCNALRTRQIKETSTSDGYESTMISLLNKRFGEKFTEPLRNQLNELEKSRIYQRQFKDHLNSKGVQLGFDFRPKCFMLKGGIQNFKFTLPDELQQAWGEFCLFFEHRNEHDERNENHRRKKIEFNNTLSSGVIYCHLNKSVHTLEVSTLQMAVLLLFNRHERITEEDMAISLGVEMETLKAALEHLKRREFLIYSGTLVEVNMNFTNRKRRLNFNIDTIKTRKIEVNSGELKIKRSHIMDAAIVRILKKNKELKHSQLIIAVFEELKNQFTPQKCFIEERLEALLKKGVPDIERCGPENMSYRYV
ncbi:cullin homolog 1 [Drosophila teissieri]|uniref:cullin homolog 1 n=1 Tax=Drosophila teissieri TaxID=7243 RepID=UPI001CB9F5A6|nr:cullin homolog 1 [Drosophila teissieri]